MAVIYGWSYADFNTALGWDIGAEPKYLLWENFWAHKIESYVFIKAGASPRFTDANEIIEIAVIVNEMMVQMNIYLKAESVENPLEMGLLEAIGFPSFKGDPEANDGKGTLHYFVLNKYKRQHSVLKIASIRIGQPSDNPFYQDSLNI